MICQKAAECGLFLWVPPWSHKTLDGRRETLLFAALTVGLNRMSDA